MGQESDDANRAAPQLSPDGKWWWDGEKWVPVQGPADSQTEIEAADQLASTGHEPLTEVESPATADQFDVALSYAGEDRVYVHSIAEQLQSQGVRVFYDQFVAADLWGADLYDLLDQVFRKKARFAVIFVSRYYVNKPWPRHERQSAQARALINSSTYVLPVKLDDSELPGLSPTIGYVDGRRTTSEQLVDLILKKLGKTSEAPLAAPILMGVPWSPAKIQELLARRPPGWEYLLFAAVLAQGKDNLDAKWRSHELRYVRPTGPILNEQETLTFLQGAFSDIQAHASNVERVADPRAQEAAFGPPGVPGDATQIEFLGRVLVGIYDDLLDWSARIRGARAPSEFMRACKIAADFADLPLHQIRQFIDHAVGEIERIPAWAATPPPRPPLSINLELVVSVDDAVASAFGQELDRLKRSGIVTGQHRK